MGRLALSLECFCVSMNRSAQRVRRLLPFDGLRGIAAVGVTAFHVNPMSPFLFWAWSFVDMFFVLSGFLIGKILQRGISEGNFSLKNFWIRRILRIWPVYYLTLALVVVWALLSPALHLSPEALIQSLFFLQFTGAYLHPGADWNNMVWQFLPWFSHSWSIAVEEQFYLLLPVLFWLVGVRARSIFLLVIVALSVSQWLLCANLVPHLLGTRMQGLALGLLLVPLSRWLDPSSDASSQKHRRATLVLLAASLFAGFCMMAPRCAAIFRNCGAARRLVQTRSRIWC